MVVAGILSTFALRYVEPTRGVGKLAMVSHALFAVFAVLLCFAPEKLSDLLFNEAGYAMVGVVFPVFESVRAAASPDGIARKAKGAKERAEDKNSTAARDDTRWLTYWIAAGSIWLCTEWLDSFREAFPQFAENFYQARRPCPSLYAIMMRYAGGDHHTHVAPAADDGRGVPDVR